MESSTMTGEMVAGEMVIDVVMAIKKKNQFFIILFALDQEPPQLYWTSILIWFFCGFG